MEEEDIPFHRKAPAGMHVVPPEESRREELAIGAGIPMEMIDGGLRRREEAEKRRRRQEEAKDRAREKTMPGTLLQAAKAGEAAAMQRMRKRSKLMLPEPQVSERELAEIARIGADTAKFEADAALAKEKPTGALLANYGVVATPTVGGAVQFKTPLARTPATRDTLLLEAENLARLTFAPTPLVGGVNEPLHPSDFTGVAPKRDSVRTPNVFATPRVIAGATPRMPGATPIRDGLRINDPGERDVAAVVKSAKEDKARRIAQRKEFEALLGALPAPKYRYRVALPKEGGGEEGEDASFVEDAADAVVRQKREKEKAREALLAQCSEAMQRGLPRITRVAADGHEEETASEKMISDELCRLVAFELHHFPVDGSQAPTELLSQSTEATAAEIASASALVDAELGAVDAKEHSTVWDGAVADLGFLPSAKRWVCRSKLSGADQLEMSKADFAQAKVQFEAEAAKAARLEKRVTV
jgi:pre-mRNA-splicing factor CDC5/CEF1